MAHTLDEKDNVIMGSPLVQPNDNLFWFGHPKFVLTLLHLTLFMNSFELAFFVWVTIDTEFIEVIAFRHVHNVAFEKSDLFFICMLRPL
ncbi:MLO-like protein [Humulus lupulus]|uniref:MLO-like protein n=1 Tax=Humulus lupulus TaxID=3486 RepID=UPI002B403A6B|nr:MLO-like protein [Humulus lupulus]